MASLLAGFTGAIVGVLGVLVGAWLAGRREHQRWKRGEQLRAAIDFIGASGEVYDGNRRGGTPSRAPEEMAKLYDRLQDGRSALYLLCEQKTVDVAEELIQRVRQVPALTDGTHDGETLTLLSRLVALLREELGVKATKRELTRSV